MKNKLVECKSCGNQIAKNAKTCPSCGAKNKKPIYKKFWFWLVVVFSLLALIGSNGEEAVDDNTKPIESQNSAEVAVDVEDVPTTDATEKQNKEEKTEFVVGEELVDGGLKLVYVASGEYKEDEYYLQPENGYKYIYLKFAAENISDKHDVSVSEFSFNCFADGYAADAYYVSEDSFSATLSAGKSTMGIVCFTVPVDATEIEIEYTPNAFLNDKYIFLYEGEKAFEYVAPKNTEASENAYAVGSIAESSNLKIHYLACETYSSGNWYVQPKSGYRFVSCTFEFENIGDYDEVVSSFDFDCYADGMNCVGVYSREDDLSATISAGRKAKGTVTFEVPIDATVIEMEFLSNYWTSNRVVFTVE